MVKKVTKICKNAQNVRAFLAKIRKNSYFLYLNMFVNLGGIGDFSLFGGDRNSLAESCYENLILLIFVLTSLAFPVNPSRDCSMGLSRCLSIDLSVAQRRDSSTGFSIDLPIDSSSGSSIEL